MLKTSIPDLVLHPLSASHAREVHALLQKNRAHLTAYGDYTDEVSASVESIEDELAPASAAKLRFGIMFNGQLVGRIDLIPVDPPRYSVGYWLAEYATGHGYATAALAALTEFAQAELQATDLYAGVTHGNYRSAAVLKRAGFLPAETFEKYTRFHRSLPEQLL